MSAPAGRLEATLGRDRSIVLAGLTAVTLIAWAYLAYVSSRMSGMATMDMPTSMAMPQTRTWGTVDLVLLFLMWAVMMMAMMVPSSTPIILTLARAERRKGSDRVLTSAAVLLLGYLLVWWVFSAVASLVQWRLHSTALMSPAMVSTSSALGGILLIAAGVYQFSSLKRACLVRCRSPMSFLMAEWKPGRWGAFTLGVKHGVYCVSCCALLMSLLFVAGVMNLLWVAAIGLFVLIERVAPHGELFGRITGAALIVAGIALIAR